MPDFLAETAEIRESDWTAAPIPADLRNRRVEIAGPVNREMVVRALNSGADMYMADFEDSNSPTWDNCVDGQVNLRDAVRGTVEFTGPEGTRHTTNGRTPAIFVRPRGWHLDERHMKVDGEPVPAALFDFGLFFFHNAARLVEMGSGPYFYLPKLEGHLEARLWNDVFEHAQRALGIPHGTIRATALIETILAAFEMDEILFELREHSAGLNHGCWDYLFSFIKRFRNHSSFLLPDRDQVTMDQHFMHSSMELLIHTCHRRGIHAIAGMNTQIPIECDPASNVAALRKVRQDKLREVEAGSDGTWVGHPELVAIAKESFESYTKAPNQIPRLRTDVAVTSRDLLAVPEGEITEGGLRTNIRIGILYLESWLRGEGSVSLDHTMEGTATVEISRSQVWQWIRHGARLSDGRLIDADMATEMMREELDRIRKETGERRYLEGPFDLASKLFAEMITSGEFPEFLSSVAYDYLD
jgi:malate synthase